MTGRSYLWALDDPALAAEVTRLSDALTAALDEQRRRQARPRAALARAIWEAAFGREFERARQEEDDAVTTDNRKEEA